jgi:hypothetical protein
MTAMSSPIKNFLMPLVSWGRSGREDFLKIAIGKLGLALQK